VIFVGVDKLYAAFLNESRTRGRCLRGVQEIRASRGYLARCGTPAQAYRSTDAVENLSFRASSVLVFDPLFAPAVKFACDADVFRSVDDDIAPLRRHYSEVRHD
jgi:hypothetical protein